MPEIETKITFSVDSAGKAKASSAYKDLSNDLDDMVKAQEKAVKRQKELAQQMKEQLAFEQSVRKQSYDTPSSSKRAGIGGSGAGDAGLGKLQSGLSALDNLSKGIDVGTIINATEGVTDLASSLGSLPNLFGNLTSAAGLAGIALAGVTLVFGQVMAEADKQAKSIRSQLDLERETAYFKAEGGTLEEAQKIAEDAKALADAEADILAQNKERYESFRKQLGIIGDIATLYSPQEQELADEVTKAQANLDALNKRASAYQSLADSGALASEGLNEQLKDISDNADNATTTLKKVSDEEKALSSERKKAEEVMKEAQRAEEERANALRALSEKLVDIATRNAQAEEDSALQLNDARSDARRKLNSDLAGLDEKAKKEAIKAVVDIQAEEAQNARSHAQNMLKIQEDAQKQREDLSANLDFAGLFALEKDTNTALKEASNDYDFDRKERQLANDTALADLKVSSNEERKARQNAYTEEIKDTQRQFERTSRDRRTAYEREIQEANNAYERQFGALKQKFARENDLYEQSKIAMAGSSISRGGASVGTAPKSRIGNPPTGGGSVNSRMSVQNIGGDTNTFSFQISGNNPQAIGAQVREEMMKVFGVKP